MHRRYVWVRPFRNSDNMRTVDGSGRSVAAAPGGGGGATQTTDNAHRPGTRSRAATDGTVLYACRHACCSPERERSAVMSAVLSDGCLECCTGVSLRRLDAVRARVRAGAYRSLILGHGARAYGQRHATCRGGGRACGRRHTPAPDQTLTRHATSLTSTGLLHCCFWCAASGSGATAIQLGEVHHAKRKTRSHRCTQHA